MKNRTDSYVMNTLWHNMINRKRTKLEVNQLSPYFYIVFYFYELFVILYAVSVFRYCIIMNYGSGITIYRIIIGGIGNDAAV